MMRAAVVLCVVCAVAFLSAVHAKIVSTSGQVTWMGPGHSVPLPANTWSYQPGTNFGSFSSPLLDVASPSVNGVIGCGTFDEKQGVVLTESQVAQFQLDDGSQLTAGVPYDSIYYFCHQTYALDQGSYQASGTVTTDNKFVGCTTSNGVDDIGANEIASDQFFGLTDQIYYQNETQGARGFEGGDTGVPFGTTSVFTNTWSEPGDYVRCFSLTCGTCQCTTTAALTNPAYCLNAQNPTQTLQISDLTTTFTDTCSYVTASSFYAQFIGAGASSDGQSITVSTSSPSTVTVLLTAGCGCSNQVSIQLNPCGGCTDCASAVTVNSDCSQTSASSQSKCVSLSFSDTATGC